MSLTFLLFTAIQIYRIYDQGHSVVGIEGVEEPITDFFKEQGLSYKKVELKEGLASYSVSIYSILTDKDILCPHQMFKNIINLIYVSD